MDPTTLDDVAQNVGADIIHGDPLTIVGPDVVIDSRKATAGSLFVAFVGEHVDGHDYVAAAAQRGAVAAVVSRPLDIDVPQLLCEDPQEALAALARGIVSAARQTGLTTIAVTGSSGKTSAKDMIASILESAAPTVAPVGSFNNEIGVPLTACGVTSKTRFLVSEMGARGHGHIDWLLSVVPADVAVVLNIGTAHLGEFGTVDDIAAAKGEILTGEHSDGWAVLNAEDDRVAAMAGTTSRRVVWFSSSRRPSQPGEAYVWASDVTADDLARHSFTLHWVCGSVDREATVSLQYLGRHALWNALAAAAACLVAGVDLIQVAHALSNSQVRSAWRMELDERCDGVAILNDSYNANPESMMAGLRTLHDLGVARKRHHRDSSTIAVLGEMRELGPDAAETHADVGRAAARIGIDRLICIGPFASQYAAGAASVSPPIPVVEVAADKSRIVEILNDSLRPGDLVLVKASRAAELETVASDLLKGGKA